MQSFAALDCDSQRTITQILERGYYNRCETLGEGGWPYLTQFIDGWKSYWLFGHDGETHFDDSITAKNDKAAKAAFHSKYHLNQLDSYTIVEQTINNRIVETIND